LSRKETAASFQQTEIVFLIDGYVSGKIPDYQVAAFLMGSLLFKV